MTQATGKYILFLDSGDYLHPNSLLNLITFFDSCESDVDVVLPHMHYILSSGEHKTEESIYLSHLINTGVYDIRKTPICFRDILPCIRNNVEIRWDTSLDYHSDKLFFFKVANRTFKFGYMKEAYYNRIDDDDSYRSYLRKFKKLSEEILQTAEKIESLYDMDIAYGAQNCIVQMFNDHVLNDDSFWPHQYSEDLFESFKNRVSRVLYYIDTKVILNHISLDKYTKSYWINLKNNKDTVIEIAKDKIQILIDGCMLEKRKDVEWTLRRITVQKNCVTIYGDFKLALFDFLSDNDELNFTVCINNEHEDTLDVKTSFSGYPKGSRIKMNQIWAFKFSCCTDDVKQIELFVYINGIKIKTRIVNCYNTVFGKKLSLTSAPVGNIFISEVEKRMLTFQFLNNEEVIQKRKIISQKFTDKKYVYELREACNDYIERKIWLYNDNFAMIDNGYYLFLHDLDKKDNIERYYIIKNKKADIYVNADDELKKHFLIYGSMEHILCFLNAEKIFTAFTSGLEWRALQHNEMYCYWDIFRAEIILLSHGVLNQYWPWSFSPIRMPIDKVVVSTYEEKRAWSENGFWEGDFICSGMPRYAEILKQSESTHPSNRKIVVALSWRMYLAGKHEILLDAATPRISMDDLYTNSSYFKNLMAFLNSKRLAKVLEKNNVDIDVNLHPQFQLIYREHTNIKNPRIHLTAGNIRLADYSALISDISSIIFDFAIYKRPIQYFIPDIEEFKSGCNHFRELILPFEDGLGPYAVTVESAVENICTLIENDFIMDKVYQERLENFHLPLDEPCEKIYQYCCTH